MTTTSNTHQVRTDILIIGGGLSGLALADHLTQAGADVHVVEGRNRLGGRILTETVNDAGFDVGPAWFWPGQPRMAAIVDRFALTKFDQYASGLLSAEDAQGQVQRGQGFSSMDGSWRLKGGFGAVISAFANRIPPANITRNAKVTALTKTNTQITATTATGQTFTAQQVVFALPPRIATQIAFEPTLPDAALTTMINVPTWMAGQAKAVAVYDTPFWRDAGLSGDAMSRFGPMVEIHDASPATGGPYALFGFIGVPPNVRLDESRLRDQILAQLTRLFGANAASPRDLIMKDWAQDAFTAHTADHAPLYAHPTYSLPTPMQGLWDNTLHFAGTEVAPAFGGYLEGALEAAEITAAHLLHRQ